ncbi:peptidase [Rhodococcus sp. X156]|uniref:peptidase n=1 Tax=Rhodococcus sp. X156 TaxID=2499145 RepID=UPI000FD6F0D7|nr:peptidase [Rhodococcus sp. X156]
MPGQTSANVEVAPLHVGGELRGFMVSGRWPASTREWTQLLVLAVRTAAVPGLLPTTTVFGVHEECPDDPDLRAVGMVTAEGPVLGEGAVQPGRFAGHQPPALLMLHPPSETTPSLPECAGVASGCLLLPGIPYLGLAHRAAWVETEPGGTITGLISRDGVDPSRDPDTAVLAMLLAA